MNTGKPLTGFEHFRDFCLNGQDHLSPEPSLLNLKIDPDKTFPTTFGCIKLHKKLKYGDSKKLEPVTHIQNSPYFGNFWRVDSKIYNEIMGNFAPTKEI